ncbi:hypothetical protein [Arthrobacter sp. B1805]|uniref:hypothetical protein n=1 Tax=Arthrobacter sp. B1805 TaxID=2058892 RepID=UPI0021583893|nr:hypothetical protein [Arthrobacter sp. B1805]
MRKPTKNDRYGMMKAPSTYRGDTGVRILGDELRVRSRGEERQNECDEQRRADRPIGVIRTR